MDTSALFSGWVPLIRIMVVGTAAYVALIAMLRTSGKRTLSKLNAFDLVVTVALGSAMATVLLSKEVALMEGLVAFGLLIVLQFAVTWTSQRSTFFRGLVDSEPAVLVRRGEMIRSAMRRERVLETDLLAAIRQSGGMRMQDAEAVLLEADGSLTAILAQP
jgi:uncharacterized membrane protein YcaP (DUF421 family)